MTAVVLGLSIQGIFLSFCLLYRRNCLAMPSGAPCGSDPLEPSQAAHGLPSTKPSPYGIQIFSANDSAKTPVSSYKLCELYRIDITGPEFRGLLIQVRELDSGGNPQEDKKVGDFIEEPSWINIGLRHQKCSAITPRDSVTHKNTNKKKSVSLLWQPTSANADVQILMTVAKTQQKYWSFIKPLNGRLTKEISNSPSEISKSTCT